MSTIVVVKKAGMASIAADSLVSCGDLRLTPVYNAAFDKIQVHGDSLFGIVGSAAHELVMDSILRQEEVTVDFSNRIAIFETFRQFHPVLKEKYFLNAKDEEEDPYEASHIDALIANPNGIFGIYSLREVVEYERFWAIGSGAEYAMGAMFAVYDRFESAEDIARVGVEAGAEFNNATALPLTQHTIKLKQ